MKKQILSILTATAMTLSAMPFTVSAEATEDTELWDRFLKYDLGITYYNSLSNADQELCRFIFDTETNAYFNDGEIAVCERARRIITNSKNYTARITIDDLKNQTLLCDLYSGYGFYNECTPDIIYLDDNVNKSEYWLDDEGKIKVVQQFNHNTGCSMSLIASALTEDDIYNNDFPYSDVLEIEENGNTYTVTYQLDFKNIVSVNYNFETDTFTYFDEETCSNLPLGDDFIIEDGNVYHIVDDDTVVLYISKYKNNLLYNENAEPVDIVIPEYVEGYNVRGICGQAFRMADTVLIMQSLANPDKYGVDGTDETHITEQGIDNGDMDENGLTNDDALEIQKIMLKIT